MISTPRTNEQVRDYGNNPFVSPDFARQLERELTSAQQTIAQKDGEIRALREALKSFMHADGCFCDAVFTMGNGAHPRHSDECVAAHKALSTTSPSAVVPWSVCQIVLEQFKICFDECFKLKKVIKICFDSIQRNIRYININMYNMRICI